MLNNPLPAMDGASIPMMTLYLMASFFFSSLPPLGFEPAPALVLGGSGNLAAGRTNPLLSRTGTHGILHQSIYSKLSEQRGQLHCALCTMHYVLCTMHYVLCIALHTHSDHTSLPLPLPHLPFTTLTTPPHPLDPEPS